MAVLLVIAVFAVQCPQATCHSCGADQVVGKRWEPAPSPAMYAVMASAFTPAEACSAAVPSSQQPVRLADLTFTCARLVI